MQKLHNRIRVIQEEEKRVLRKVDEDRRRAKLLEDVKMENQTFKEQVIILAVHFFFSWRRSALLIR